MSPELPQSASSLPASPSFDLRRYSWFDSNRTKGFETWEAEVAHVEALGFKLVPPDYRIAHWSESMRTGANVPPLYVNTHLGPRLMSTAFDRFAAEIGYPLFFKAST